MSRVDHKNPADLPEVGRFAVCEEILPSKVENHEFLLRSIITGKHHL